MEMYLNYDRIFENVFLKHGYTSSTITLLKIFLDNSQLLFNKLSGCELSQGTLRDGDADGVMVSKAKSCAGYHGGLTDRAIKVNNHHTFCKSESMIC